jgi:hypothetical protein
VIVYGLVNNSLQAGRRVLRFSRMLAALLDVLYDEPEWIDLLVVVELDLGGTGRCLN